MAHANAAYQDGYEAPILWSQDGHARHTPKALKEIAQHTRIFAAWKRAKETAQVFREKTNKMKLEAHRRAEQLIHDLRHVMIAADPDLSLA